MRGNGKGVAVAEESTEILDYREAASALESVTRAEIDVQIATAKKWPRSPEKFLREALSIIGMSPEVAAACRYRLPARGDGGKPIEGPSVRMAEVVACTWGNLRIVGRITDDDGRSITAQGVAIDLERNVGYSVEVRRSVVTRNGKRYGDDMMKTTCNAAISIATRNATFKVVPRALVSVLEDEAMAVARGDVKTLPERLGKALSWFAGKGVKEEEVMQALGCVGRADVTLDHLMTLNGYRTAMQEGHATADEIFRRPKELVQAPQGGTRAESLVRRISEPEFAPGTAGAITTEAEDAGREPGEEG